MRQTKPAAIWISSCRQVAAITLDAEVVDEGPNGYRVRFSGTRTVWVPAGYQVALELHTRTCPGVTPER